MTHEGLHDVILVDFFSSAADAAGGGAALWRVLLHKLSDPACHDPSSLAPHASLAYLDEERRHIKALEFNPQLHAGLIDELKLLYVAVTRARNHLLLFESDTQAALPAYYFLQRKRLADRALEGVGAHRGLQSLLQPRESSPSDWAAVGQQLVAKGAHEEAANAFRSAGDCARAYWCTAQAVLLAARDEDLRAKLAQPPANLSSAAAAEAAAAERVAAAARDRRAVRRAAALLTEAVAVARSSESAGMPVTPEEWRRWAGLAGQLLKRLQMYEQAVRSLVAAREWRPLLATLIAIRELLPRRLAEAAEALQKADFSKPSPKPGSSRAPAPAQAQTEEARAEAADVAAADEAPDVEGVEGREVRLLKLTTGQRVMEVYARALSSRVGECEVAHRRAAELAKAAARAAEAVSADVEAEGTEGAEAEAGEGAGEQEEGAAVARRRELEAAAWAREAAEEAEAAAAAALAGLDVPLRDLLQELRSCEEQLSAVRALLPSEDPALGADEARAEEARAEADEARADAEAARVLQRAEAKAAKLARAKEERAAKEAAAAARARAEAAKRDKEQAAEETKRVEKEQAAKRAAEERESARAAKQAARAATEAAAAAEAAATEEAGRGTVASRPATGGVRVISTGAPPAPQAAVQAWVSGALLPSPAAAPVTLHPPAPGLPPSAVPDAALGAQRGKLLSQFQGPSGQAQAPAHLQDRAETAAKPAQQPPAAPVSWRPMAGRGSPAGAPPDARDEAVAPLSAPAPSLHRPALGPSALPLPSCVWAHVSVPRRVPLLAAPAAPQLQGAHTLQPVPAPQPPQNAERSPLEAFKAAKAALAAQRVAPAPSGAPHAPTAAPAAASSTAAAVPGVAPVRPAPGPAFPAPTATPAAAATALAAAAAALAATAPAAAPMGLRARLAAAACVQGGSGPVPLPGGPASHSPAGPQGPQAVPGAPAAVSGPGRDPMTAAAAGPASAEPVLQAQGQAQAQAQALPAAQAHPRALAEAEAQARDLAAAEQRIRELDDEAEMQRRQHEAQLAAAEVQRRQHEAQLAAAEVQRRQQEAQLAAAEVQRRQHEAQLVAADVQRRQHEAQLAAAQAEAEVQRRQHEAQLAAADVQRRQHEAQLAAAQAQALAAAQAQAQAHRDQIEALAEAQSRDLAAAGQRILELEAAAEAAAAVAAEAAAEAATRAAAAAAATAGGWLAAGVLPPPARAPPPLPCVDRVELVMEPCITVRKELLDRTTRVPAVGLALKMEAGRMGVLAVYVPPLPAASQGSGGGAAAKGGVVYVMDADPLTAKGSTLLRYVEELLMDPHVVKVVHGAEQVLPPLESELRVRVAPVVDTAHLLEGLLGLLGGERPGAAGAGAAAAAGADAEGAPYAAMHGRVAARRQRLADAGLWAGRPELIAAVEAKARDLEASKAEAEGRAPPKSWLSRPLPPQLLPQASTAAEHLPELWAVLRGALEAAAHRGCEAHVDAARGGGGGGRG
ncbi:hypothetical protein HYH03_001957 [Edaphochlamys debaryana]|uniref:Uncharacterized protein n=1 Tax=Edaphochlamys debaryana TaxID=47281 RepID=A0A835YEN9_9CHLO|nr:hypothetical protein HYH03_001957 [Edaphochlamys debaryana]|eukprot:KAG2500384.1 hypothetical protein HYH03_001957 [Edaphochlamys debaryana]